MSRPRPQPQLADYVQSEITDSIEKYHKWWRNHGFTASAIMVASISISFIAGICAATKSISDPFWSAVLTGLPALILTIDQSFKFRARSDWFWNLVLRYQSLQRAIERGDLTDEEASRKIDEIEDSANATDPSVGMAARSLNTQPSSPPKPTPTPKANAKTKTKRP